MSDTTQATSAPVLSTTQDETEAFAKVEGLTDEILREKRQHLGPEYVNNRNITMQQTRDLISKYYSLDKLAEYLNKRDKITKDLKYQLVSLQFPDNLVCDSTIVSQILQEKLNAFNKTYHDISHVEGEAGVKKINDKEIDFTSTSATSMSRDIESVEKTIDNKTCAGNCGSACKNKSKYNQEVWILADTSYSPCCIDEVAAEHIKADIVVHFGDACLTPVDKINSCYIFGRPYINLDGLIETFKKCYSDSEAKVVLMADAPYSYILPILYKRLEGEYNNLVIANIDYSKAAKHAKIIDSVETDENGSQNEKVNTANRVLSGISNQYISDYLETVDFEDVNYVQSGKFDALTQEYSLFHITRPHDARLLLLTTKFNDLKIIDPQNVQIVHDQFPTLMKRYRSMQVARSATTVGILVNTLSLANTKVLLNQIVKSIVDAGKKHYMFVVGKPNVAKLANFECVDVWCIIGCGQSGIVIDMWGDYYKPIITPYELQLALMPQVTWTGKWVTDFDTLLEKQNEEEETNELPTPLSNEDDDNEDDEDNYAPEFDPVTGKLKMNQPLRQLLHLELEIEMENFRKTKPVDETGLVKSFSSSLAVGKTISTSALGLQGRQWTGLGSDFTEADPKEGAIVEDGRTGVARGYTDV